MSQTTETTQDITVQEPSAMRMSNYAERSYRQQLRDRLQGLLDSGRMTPAEFEERAGTLDAVKLSLGEDGEPEPSALDAFIDARKDVPEGTFFDTETRTRMSNQPTAEGHPAAPKASQGQEESDEEIDAAVERMSARR